MKTIKKIVITGGPCAGKTDVLGKVSEHFNKLGWRVILIPETATQMMLNGISPDSCANRKEFQGRLLTLQLEKEKAAEQEADKLNEGKILIVCDRGALDSRAYISAEEFAEIAENTGMNEIALRDGYDAVFHLVTTARGAADFYTTENNSTRTETIEEALQLDDNIISAWTGHPHLRIIDNSTDFIGKTDRLNSEIAAFLGEPEPYEIERKYLIEYPDTDELLSLPFCRAVDIIQTYLISSDNEEVRLRQRGTKDGSIFFKTIKKYVSPTTRIELEERLTQEKYLAMLTQAEAVVGQICKTRYCLVSDNQYFEIDVYPFWQDKAVMELELRDENQEIIFPPQIKIIKEVTQDKRFSNYSLAVNSDLKNF